MRQATPLMASLLGAPEEREVWVIGAFAARAAPVIVGQGAPDVCRRPCHGRSTASTVQRVRRRPPRRYRPRCYAHADAADYGAAYRRRAGRPCRRMIEQPYASPGGFSL